MNWDFHPEALAEYEAAATYYAAHDQTFKFDSSKQSKPLLIGFWNRQLAGA
jgi:hypothetical protein